ncbi:hypothetical protein L596_019317 [Steinernema carpocapsae]|uniref:Uncharacterized protein n=1 Tax=Steinernema carpocapsae TaxID=34508 RepID=A0A4U5MR26_STECR|nr:hypothetical protein L596_019317 [Steinernema carpocapsae]
MTLYRLDWLVVLPLSQFTFVISTFLTASEPVVRNANLLSSGVPFSSPLLSAGRRPRGRRLRRADFRVLRKEAPPLPPWNTDRTAEAAGTRTSQGQLHQIDKIGTIREKGASRKDSRNGGRLRGPEAGNAEPELDEEVGADEFGACALREVDVALQTEPPRSLPEQQVQSAVLGAIMKTNRSTLICCLH